MPGLGTGEIDEELQQELQKLQVWQLPHTSEVSQVITDNMHNFNSMWQPCTVPQSIMAPALLQPPHHMHMFL